MPELRRQQLPKKRDSSKASSDAMAVQIKTMSDPIAQLTKKLDKKENTPNGRGGGGGGGGGGGDGGGGDGSGGGGGGGGSEL